MEFWVQFQIWNKENYKKKNYKKKIQVISCHKNQMQQVIVLEYLDKLNQCITQEKS